MSYISQYKCYGAYLVCSSRQTIPVPRAQPTCSGLLAARSLISGMQLTSKIQFEAVKPRRVDPQLHFETHGLRVKLQQAYYW